MSALYEYGNALLLTNPEIITSRKIIQLDFSDLSNLSDQLNQSNQTEQIILTKLLELNLSDANNYNIVSCLKTQSVGYSMKWHLDDAQVIKHRKGFVDKLGKQKPLNEKVSIYYPKKVPEYSAIVYLSNYGKDFTGGVFEFADEIQIEPSFGLCVLFDSREVHRVSTILSGTRSCILFKFYKIEK